MKVAQSCLTLSDTMDYTVQGILQVAILEWVAFPSPGDLPDQGIEPGPPALQVDSLQTELWGLILVLLRDHTKEAPNHFPIYINIYSANRILL